jgi:Spy/CpxP family protein refolding chaperone
MTRQRWIGLILALSAAFNFTFLGAFGYRLWSQKRHRPNWAGERGAFGPPGFPNGGPIRDMQPPPIEFRMEQREHLKNMRGEFMPKVGRTHGVLFQKRRALFDLVMAEKPDTAAVGRAIEEIGRLQVQIEKDVFSQMLREREVMDPEQRARFREQIMKRLREADRPFGPPGGMPPLEPRAEDSKRKPFHPQEDTP